MEEGFAAKDNHNDNPVRNGELHHGLDESVPAAASFRRGPLNLPTQPGAERIPGPSSHCLREENGDDDADFADGDNVDHGDDDAYPSEDQSQCQVASENLNPHLIHATLAPEELLVVDAAPVPVADDNNETKEEIKHIRKRNRRRILVVAMVVIVAIGVCMAVMHKKGKL